VNISTGSCHQTFTEQIQMRRISAKFAPRLLPDVQKENRVEISQELLANLNGNENFLKNIITGDKDFSCFPNLKTTLKGHRFQTIRGVRVKCDKRTARYHRKCAPGSILTMEETLGTVYRK
jgi:hypothetical protein